MNTFAQQFLAISVE